MYHVLLPVPVVVSQKQMLQRMPHLQLGLCDDVHTAVLRAEVLQLEPAGAVHRAARALGDHLLPAPRAVLGEDERLSPLRELRIKSSSVRKLMLLIDLVFSVLHFFNFILKHIFQV